ncbi:GNAT family N-acetyltransferase [Paenibacillus qinlingensis]|uniref:Ribosomal protein S18 acetylase RimI-like enzyme n=1 Tax=Paenibacillus qinlingensis TaxID=1837343 RepID=A0ABU1P2M6_9BACL|nr:GNAT family N-acetyltransferase [Paenibacillus qinlingensis]MDR6553327.1 ribosomal protein S18 acetylase RimI-like enzyme [Paenibacillus qinlingensis]
MLITWDDSYRQAVIALWNDAAVKDGYKELTEQSLDDIFLSNRYFDKENTFLLLADDKVIGFACGCTGDELPLGEVAGYLTCIVLASGYETDDRYFMLLTALEDRFKQLGKKQADILFFNPMLLPWYIPGTDQHEHNNAPGVPLDSKLYTFLLKRGYVERAKQCAMYLHLSGFSIPDEISVKEAKASAQGYTIARFDPGKHAGVEDMLEGFGNPLWTKEIGASVRTGVPVVIAAYQGKTIGFAGPVIRQSNGRGYFAGIGVLPDHEGHGLGSLLFFKLCEAFQSIGTDYMSLFTGISNPAIRIYERAGFQTVKQFAVMRREFEL